MIFLSRSRAIVFISVLVVLFTGLDIQQPTAPAKASVAFDDGTVFVQASAKGIEFSWEADSFNSLEITGKEFDFATSHTSGQTSDFSVLAGSMATYQIEIRSALKKDLFEKMNAATQAEAKASPMAFESIELKSFTIQVPTSGVVGFESEPANAATLPSATSFRYSTFISDYAVFGPFVIGCGYFGSSYFDGDNRSFDAASTSYRTRVNVRIDWSLGGVISSTKTAGKTVLHQDLGWFDSFGAWHPYLVTKTDYANTDRILVTPAKETSTESVFVINHRAGNPLCSSIKALGADIEYNYTVTVQRSGGYGLVGWAKRAPSHEAYIRDSFSPGWQTVFQRNNTGFDCLISTYDYCEAWINYSGVVQ